MVDVYGFTRIRHAQYALDNMVLACLEKNFVSVVLGRVSRSKSDSIHFVVLVHVCSSFSRKKGFQFCLYDHYTSITEREGIVICPKELISPHPSRMVKKIFFHHPIRGIE